MRMRSAALPLGRAARFCVLVAPMVLGAAPAGAQTVAPPGAASCSGCHARGRTLGVIVPLAGRSTDDIVAAMTAFRSGERPATVMDRLAKGFTDEEMRAIAAFVGKQQ